MPDRAPALFEIGCDHDVARVRGAVRALAGELSFSLVDRTRIATAVSELARNTLIHGGGGHAEVSHAVSHANGAAAKTCIRCVFVDQGPGIADVALALSDGFTTGSGLGQGLPGSKRLMDSLTITARPEGGTRVEVEKWK